MQKVKLESLVKELELKTIKSHINPHFIFNALNSIRALVDENPDRARTAIRGMLNTITFIQVKINIGLTNCIGLLTFIFMNSTLNS